MPPAKPGSLGLLLLFHTTRALYTLIAHSLYIIQTNLHLWLYLARTVAVCFSIFASTFFHVGQICSTAVEGALATWAISLSVVFVWAVPYAIFLSGVFSVAVFVVVLEQCETVYLILPSFLRGTEAPVSPEAASPARQSLVPLDQSVAMTELTSNEPTPSPSSTASTTQPNPSQSSHSRNRRPVSFGSFIGQALHLITKRPPVAVECPDQPEEELPPRARTEPWRNCSGDSEDEMDLSSSTNPVSRLKHFLVSTIVTFWEKYPTPTQTPPAFPSVPRMATLETPDDSPSPHRQAKQQDTPLPPIFDVNALTGAAARNDENQPPLSKSGEVTFTSSSESSPSLAPSSGIQSKFNSRPSSRVEKKRIPKSRTMAVLSNLTASLSRTSLTSFTSDRKASTSRSVSSRKVSGSSTSTLSTTDTSRVPTPMSAEVNPLIINTAQSSQYWAGRFQSLHDRFHNEDLQPHSLATLVSAHASRSTVVRDQRAAYQSRGNLPLSTTTALDRYSTTAVSRETKVLDEEDNRCLRVFIHLDSLCATPEAQKSLHAWQEIYARRNNRVALLPHGVSMDKGFVARIFGGGRRSMGAPRPEKQVIEGKYRTGKRVSML
ncbi:hypothetical protein GQ607_005256 [Colletotrichum asianum]|uniref:Uncharacterized protein n=1 Tax=Colletotrichum asianum TaxID=702518 RepID=A0A8H3WJ24_9PEZI|nr:hypothetical protein GQ607_005256 [Colletotrichum asianum]